MVKDFIFLNIIRKKKMNFDNLAAEQMMQMQKGELSLQRRNSSSGIKNMVQYNKLTAFIKRINQLEVTEKKGQVENQGAAEDIIPKLPESI